MKQTSKYRSLRRTNRKRPIHTPQARDAALVRQTIHEVVLDQLLETGVTVGTQFQSLLGSGTGDFAIEMISVPCALRHHVATLEACDQETGVANGMTIAIVADRERRHADAGARHQGETTQKMI